MMNESEKLSRLSREVMEEAAAEAARLRAEADEIYEKQLAEGRERLIREIDRARESEEKRIGRTVSRERSRAEQAAREELLRAREAVVAAVTEAVRGKLAAFAASPEYPAFLTALCCEAADLMGGSMTVTVSPRDLPLKYDLLAALDERRREHARGQVPVYSVDADPAIKLGGARFRAAAPGNLLMNETLDERLVRMRDGIAAAVAAEVHTKAEGGADA